MPEPVKKLAEKKEVVQQPEIDIGEKEENKPGETGPGSAWEKNKEISEQAQAEDAMKQAVEQAPLGVSVQQPIAEVAPEKDEITQELESILSDDLEDLYFQLPPNKQKEFKIKGEETAGLIKQMLYSTKVKGRKIVGWIKDWLKMIPGVNKFFLEQEAKIKTDQILLLAEEEKKKQAGEIE
ncbi:MAG: hypothetical protein ABIH67_01130 [Candidatus Uhrbacteria bacterium]